MVSSLSIRKTYLHKKWGVMPLLNLEICYLCPEPVPIEVGDKTGYNSNALIRLPPLRLIANRRGAAGGISDSIPCAIAI